ncbi:MAG: Teichoic acid translocation permease protein TagG [Chlamydiae bacterium]|nr:Teichoic acid translocation permease protein TagG [Chlamydiota bacterium]
MKKITIKPEHPWLQVDFAELFDFRWVFWMLIVRDIKLRYKQTFLGVAWVVLQPLLTALLFTVVFGRMIKVPSDGLPYALFAFCGLVPWLLFSQSLQRASNSLVGDMRLITKVYFPRIYIPLSATFGVVIDFLIALALLFLLMGFYGQPISPHIFFLPVATLVLFAFSSGINLLFSSFNVYYRDFKHMVPFLVQLWMYASPLVYSGTMIPERFRLLYSLNPVAGIIDAFRWSILGTTAFPYFSFSVATIAATVLLGGGILVFRKIEHSFADII